MIGPAAAQTPPIAPGQAQEIAITLKPGEGAEVKAELTKGTRLAYAWTVEGGTVNHDPHGEAAQGGSEQSYSKGRGVSGDKGELTAAFDGHHGWFWRNRGSKDVTVRLTATGEAGSLKRIK